MNIPFENFTSFRSGQKETIIAIRESKAKYVIVNAPTGTGKTILGMMSSIGHKSVYTVSTKILQDQIAQDFPEAVVLKGRSNYPCPRYRHILHFGKPAMADSCSKKGCAYLLDSDCQYENTKLSALRSPYRTLNLSYLLTEANGPGGFSNQELVILDEADNVEQELVGYISLELGKRDKELLGSYNLSEPEYLSKQETWKPWSEELLLILIPEEKKLENLGNNPPEYLISLKKQVKRLVSKLIMLRDCSDSTWIRYEIEGKTVYKPTWLTPILSERFLFRHGKKFVLLSATFPEIGTYCRMLGIPESDAEVIELPCTFPIENRRIMFDLDSAVDMAYKTQDIDGLLKQVKIILSRHKSDKGVIHTTSYRLKDAVMSLGDKRLTTHAVSDREAVIEAFKRSERPLVLVSPSVERGINLPDDLCRFQIIAKVPYQSTQDRVVSARLYGSKFGQQWYQADAAQRIVQMAGRGVRHGTDTCVTYILDSQFKKLYVQPRLFPKWFLEAVDIGDV